MYSTLNDLLAFGCAVLRNELLPPPLTRCWLKPWTHTRALRASVGAPWEIFRMSSLLRARSNGDGGGAGENNNANAHRVIDVYTKAGSFLAYTSYVVLLPDYGLVASMLAAAAPAAPSTIQLRRVWQHVLRQVVPAAEAVARQQAAAAYAGVYTLTRTRAYIANTTTDAATATATAAAAAAAAGNAFANSTFMRVDVDRDAGGPPGLVVREFRVLGNDVAGAFVSYSAAYYGTGDWSLRLYPTGLVSPSSMSSAEAAGSAAGADTNASRVSFRAQPGRPPPPPPQRRRPKGGSSGDGADDDDAAVSDDDDGGINDCEDAWFAWDGFLWGGNALDDFVFTLDAGGRATHVEARGWRLVLERSDAAP
jgi:hypothetical protein